MARIVVAGLAITAIGAPTMAASEHVPDSPSMYLVDDGSGSTSKPPPYNPTPSTGDGESGGNTDGGNGSGERDRPSRGNDDPQDSDDEASQDSGIPVAAQAGLSLGVIGLAVVALIPGRRPPAWMRR